MILEDDFLSECVRLCSRFVPKLSDDYLATFNCLVQILGSAGSIHLHPRHFLPGLGHVC